MSKNVRDFGATGTGNYDDTASFNRAIAASKSIYVPEGKYRVEKISVPTYTTIIGDGPTVSVLISRSGDTVLEYAGVHRSKLSGIGINNTHLNSTGHGIKSLAGGNSFVMENIECFGPGSTGKGKGIYILGGFWSSMLSNVACGNWGDDAFYIDKCGIAVTLQNCYASTVFSKKFGFNIKRLDTVAAISVIGCNGLNGGGGSWGHFEPRTNLVSCNVENFGEIGIDAYGPLNLVNTSFLQNKTNDTSIAIQFGYRENVPGYNNYDIITGIKMFGDVAKWKKAKNGKRYPFWSTQGPRIMEFGDQVACTWSPTTDNGVGLEFLVNQTYPVAGTYGQTSLLHTGINLIGQ